MKKALLLCSLALLSACVAETVERRRPRKGPIKIVGFVDMGGGTSATRRTAGAGSSPAAAMRCA